MTIPKDISELYEVREWRNASVVLAGAHPKEWEDLLAVLRAFRLRHSWVIAPGGGRSQIPIFIDGELAKRGWKKQRFETRISVTLVDEKPRGREAQKAQEQHREEDSERDPLRLVVGDDVHMAYDSPTHEVDMFKNRVAVEVEWNNKTEFYDRDLNNFRLLFELRVIDVGVVITRSDELRAIRGIGRKLGASSTNMGKLIPKIEGGGGGGCPVVVFGIKKALYVPDG